MLFLRKIVGMLSEVSPIDISDAEAPSNELQEGDRVVGILPADLKSLYVLMTRATAKGAKVLNRHKEEFEMEGDIPEDKKKWMYQECISAGLEYNLVRKAFWTCVRLEFLSLVGVNDIALRKGWQIVLTDPEAKVKKLEKAISEFLS